MNLWEVLLLFFSFVALMLSGFFLYKRKSASRANPFFSLLLLVFAYHIFFNVLFWSKFNPVLLVHLSLTDVIPLTLYGPLFFWYINGVVRGNNIGLKEGIHLIPFLLIVGVRIGFFRLEYEEKLEAIISGTVTEHVHFIPASTIILSVLMIFYGVYSFFRLVSEYKTDPELRIWLRGTSLLFILFSISCLAYFGFFTMGMMEIKHEYFINILMVLFIFGVSFFVFIYPNILNGGKIEKIIPFVKYEKTGLSEDFSLELKDRLLSVMEDEKPYLDSEVNLNKIAQLLDISRHHASQIINEHFQVHFFDFINGYRINEAKQMISSKRSVQLSVIDIAFETGFNNRISFYKAFKKVTGISPTEYIKIRVTE